MATLDTAIPWWRPAGRDVAVAAVPAGGGLAFAALVAFTAILLLSPQAWFPALKAIRIALLAAAFAMVVHVAERTSRREAITPLSPEFGIVAVLVGWAILTVPLSVWPGGSVRLLTDHYIKAVAFFWLLGTIVTTKRRLTILAWTLTLCAIPLAGTAVVNYLVGDYVSTGVRGFHRIIGYEGSLTTNPNDLALMLNLIIPITVALAVIAGGVTRAVAIGVVLLCVVAIFLTYSRAGFLTLAVSFGVFLVTLVRHRAPGRAGAFLLVALLVPVVVPNDYVARLGTITNPEADATGSAQGRWRDTKIAAGLVARHPIVGAGIGQDILVMNDERGDTWRRVHNAYLQYGVDLGIPGLLLFAWLHLTCLRTAHAVERRARGDAALRDLRLLAAGIQMSLIAFGVAAMFHPIAYQFYFFSIAGLAVALRNAYRTELHSSAASGLSRTSVVSGFSRISHSS